MSGGRSLRALDVGSISSWPICRPALVRSSPSISPRTDRPRPRSGSRSASARLSGLVTQVPAGAAVDAMADKRRAAWIGILAVSATALLYALSSSWLVVYAAELFHGLASSILTPAIAAVTLGLVGRRGVQRADWTQRPVRLGRQRAGRGTYGSRRILCFGERRLLADRGDRVAGAARGASDRTRKSRGWNWRRRGPAAFGYHQSLDGVRALFLDRRLLVFAGCILLFFLSNAAMVPIEAGAITRRHPELADVLIALTIVLPQGVVALLSPWVGRAADRWGRRPVMLLGWAMLPVQGVLYAAILSPFVVVACQLLSGVSAAVFGVMLAVVAADLTRRIGTLQPDHGVAGDRDLCRRHDQHDGRRPDRRHVRRPRGFPGPGGSRDVRRFAAVAGYAGTRERPAAPQCRCWRPAQPDAAPFTGP